MVSRKTGSAYTVLPNVRMWTPLPPRRSGIASYCHELIPELASRCNLTVVTDEVDCPVPSSVKLISPSEASAVNDEHDIDLYQLGNNRDHEFVYRRAHQVPGVLTLHDMTLHHLIEDITLGRGDFEGYALAMALDYGQAGLALAKLRMLGVFADEQRFTLTLNRTLCAKSLNMVVHSKFLQRRVEGLARKVFTIEHHSAPLSEEFSVYEQIDVRNELGIKFRGPIVLSLGFVTPPKRISSVLSALSILKEENVPFHYFIVGERNQGYDLDAEIELNGLQEHVTSVGYADENAFFKYIQACDVVTNLRFPSVGESSGTLARSMSLRKPCIVYDFGPMSEFPDEAVVKVPLELERPIYLAQALKHLLLNREYRETVGNNAHSYTKSSLTVSNSVEGYMAAIMDALQQKEKRNAAGVFSWVGDKAL